MGKSTWSKAMIKSILRRHGLRVSLEAILEMDQILTKISEEISNNASLICRRNLRRVITAEDVYLAYQNWLSKASSIYEHCS